MNVPLNLRVATCLVLFLATSSHAEDERTLYFVVAKHATIWVEGNKQEVIDVGRLIEIVEQAATESMVYWHFRMTEAGSERYDKIQRFFWPLRNKLYHEGKTRGHSTGSISPRAYDRWDRIRNQQDWEIDKSHAFSSSVIDIDGKPISDAQVFLLPEKHVNGVYLCNGRLRDPLDEHFVLTDENGKFIIQPEEGERLIAVVHPTGFLICELHDMKGRANLQLEPWASIRLGVLQERTEQSSDADSPLKISSFPVSGLEFYIWETVVESDGSFLQRYVPPGDVMIQNAFLIRDEQTFAIDNTQVHLQPAQDFDIQTKIDQ